MNYTELETIIIKNGWILVRTIGSSRQYRKPGYYKTVFLTKYGNGKVSVDVLRNLEKTTGLSLG